MTIPWRAMGKSCEKCQGMVRRKQGMVGNSREGCCPPHSQLRGMNKFGISADSWGKCPRGLLQLLGKGKGMGSANPARSDGTQLEHWLWVTSWVFLGMNFHGSVQGQVRSHWDKLVPTGINWFPLGLIRSHWGQSIPIGTGHFPLG